MIEATEAVDLFAGPGGWDVAARAVGLDPLGIEYDADACATREAAGLRTLQADVSTLEPNDYAPCEVLIGSPPCQGFSAAGKRGGSRDLPLILDGIRTMMAGEDRREELAARCEDSRSLLVLEPLRWTLALRPKLLLLEQVPPVLQLWEWIALNLQAEGYLSWTGILNAADYGVPQIRKRAILVAALRRRPKIPRATHARSRTLLGGGGEMQPWVTMAAALGWSRDELVGFPRNADTPSNRAGAGRVEIDGKAYRSRDLKSADEPANTVTEKLRSHRRMELRRGGERIEEGFDPDEEPSATVTTRADRWQLNPGKTDSQPNRRHYDPEEEPAPTIAFGHDAASWAWERPAPTLVTGRRSKDGGVVGRSLPEGEGENVGGWGYVNTGRDWKEGGDREDAQKIDGDQPAPTVTHKAGGQWHMHRPATTIQGDARVFHPGGHKANDGRDNSKMRGRSEGIRVTIEEAAILQGFPSSYPFRGTKTKQFEQVGNAVPPPLARAILAAALEVE